MPLGHHFIALREVLESFQRTRGRLFQRTIQPLNGAARFSEPGAQGRRGGSHCVQDMLFVVRLRLLPSECLAALASDHLERDDVALAQTGDGSLDGSRGCVAHADVMRDLVGDARSGSQPHQPQVLPHLLVVHDFQEGGLLKLEGEALA